MKPFRFKKFDIAQSKAVFRVGTDAVLLGAMAEVRGAKIALEVGCGTGIVALMLAQRNPDLKIHAIDISPMAATLASENFQASIFSSRLSVALADFTKLPMEQSYDLIVSNPPYFAPNDSEKDRVARQTLELNFEGLVRSAAKHLASEGILSVVLPNQFKDDFVSLAQEQGLFLVRCIAIQGISGGDTVRVILEFQFRKAPILNQEFTIESSPRVYSEAYLELTKAFHEFSPNSRHGKPL